MAQEKLQLRGIDWQETFGFTHIFRTFRLAIHPSKLVLAFAGLALCVIAGVVLDNIWYGGSPIVWENGVPVEVEVFAQKGAGSQDFDAWHESQMDTRDRTLKRWRDRESRIDADDVSIKSASIAEKLIGAKEKRLQEYLEKNSLKAEMNRINERFPNDADERTERKRRAKEEIPKRLLARRKELYEESEAIRDLVGKGPAGRGPFKALLRYELGVFEDLVGSVRNLNLLGGLGADTNRAEPGVVAHIWTGLKGLQWLLKQHMVYFVVFGAFCLLVWSVFGGAISRTSALHVARGEKISIKEALKFGMAKFPSFLFAPVIPLAIVALLGLVIAAISFLLGNLPLGLGQILVSLLMFASLLTAFAMAMVSIGTVGGMNLMYPTVAVEGSDSFDAISRSFSYVYARPWRMAFYSLVALIYGVLCYLFVRFFAFVLLKLAHVFVGLWIIKDGNSDVVNRFTTMWPGPQFADLHGGFNWWACWGVEKFGAVVIALWVYILIGFVAAFLISFFFSANTVIYCLLRKKVDSTDMDDVYVEEEPEEETPPVAEEPAEEAAAKDAKAEAQDDPEESAQSGDEKPSEGE